MVEYLQQRVPPPNRQRYCESGLEHHLTEAAVMIAFAMYLFENGALEVQLHPDGEHLKRYDVAACLKAQGFDLSAHPSVYSRGRQTVAVTCKSGLGDVVSEVGNTIVVAECKGGILNTRHPGQTSRLRKGLCEAVGLLMSRSREGERQVAVVPATRSTRNIGLKMLPRLIEAGIEIALVDEYGKVSFMTQSSSDSN
jgi:hypothetical protein